MLFHYGASKRYSSRTKFSMVLSPYDMLQADKDRRVKEEGKIEKLTENNIFVRIQFAQIFSYVVLVFFFFLFLKGNIT